MTDPNARFPNQPPPVPPLGNPALTPSQSGRKVRLFFIGLIVGTGLSALVWIVGWKQFMTTGSGTAVAVLFPLLKVGIGLLLVFIPRWRTLGAGILVSIALGVLMFGGMVIGSVADFARSSSSPSPTATAPTTQSSVTCKSLH